MAPYASNANNAFSANNPLGVNNEDGADDADGAGGVLGGPNIVPVVIHALDDGAAFAGGGVMGAMTEVGGAAFTSDCLVVQLANYRVLVMPTISTRVLIACTGPGQPNPPVNWRAARVHESVSQVYASLRATAALDDFDYETVQRACTCLITDLNAARPQSESIDAEAAETINRLIQTPLMVLGRARHAIDDFAAHMADIEPPADVSPPADDSSPPANGSPAANGSPTPNNNN